MWSPACHGYEVATVSRTASSLQTCGAADDVPNRGPGVRIDGVRYGYSRYLLDVTNTSVPVSPLRDNGAWQSDGDGAVLVLHRALASDYAAT